MLNVTLLSIEICDGTQCNVIASLASNCIVSAEWDLNVLSDLNGGLAVPYLDDIPAWLG